MKKKLNPQEAERKRTAVLLTELEQATTQVLTRDYQMIGEEADQVLVRIRAMFQQLTPIPAAPLGKQRLGQVAQRYGAAVGHVLVEDCGFSGEKANAFLGLLVAQGKANRQTA